MVFHSYRQNGSVQWHRLPRHMTIVQVREYLNAKRIPSGRYNLDGRKRRSIVHYYSAPNKPIPAKGKNAVKVQNALRNGHWDSVSIGSTLREYPTDQSRQRVSRDDKHAKLRSDMPIYRA